MSSTTQKKKYKCIFFDLDHTLWDYETNSKETLLELYTQYDLQAHGISLFEDFFQQFKTVNLSLWEQYDRGLIDSDVIRKERFKQILEPFQCYDAKLCESLSGEYLTACPSKCHVMPHAVEILEYLASEYTLTIITNGFEEIQNIKLVSGKLHSYFNHVITSQKAGHKKPAREIFEFALQCNAIRSHEAIMIGDNLITDIGGAKNAQIDTVFFNPEQMTHTATVNYEIQALEELRQIL